MKTNQTLFLAVFFSFLLTTAQAFGAISLYLVDDPINGTQNSIDVEAVLYDLNPTDTITSVLQYSFDGISFSAWSNLKNFAINETQQIHFQLEVFHGGSFFGYDATGAMEFLSYEADYYGMEAYAGVFVNWGDFQLTFLSSNSNDNFSPVPIPGAVWLLGSGLLGLVGLRKKFRKV